MLYELTSGPCGKCGRNVWRIFSAHDHITFECTGCASTRELVCMPPDVQIESEPVVTIEAVSPSEIEKLLLDRRIFPTDRRRLIHMATRLGKGLPLTERQSFSLTAIQDKLAAVA